jgi:hypothetical protein
MVISYTSNARSGFIVNPYYMMVGERAKILDWNTNFSLRGLTIEMRENWGPYKGRVLVIIDEPDCFEGSAMQRRWSEERCNLESSSYFSPNYTKIALQII